jgi:anthranilate phosphoribosyltransferase
MIREAIAHVASGARLSTTQAATTMEEIMTGQATPAQIGAFLTALRTRPGGETVEEITGLALVMRNKSVQVQLDTKSALRAIDTCGTGGDNSGTFNFSTATGILAAAAGAKVAKHGNRSATSKCGSADVLEELGIRIDLSPDQMARCVQETGFGFMFAQAYHPAMKYVGPIRREIGIRTVFNILGPLTNPAHTPYQLLGVPEIGLMRKMAESLLNLGCRHAIIIHSEDGLDECSISAPTHFCEVRVGEPLHEYAITPEQVGLISANNLHTVQGADATYNAAMLRELLSEYTDTPPTHMLCLNTGAALLACEIVSTLQDGVKLAQTTLQNGRGKQKLAEIIEFSQEIG